MSATEQLDHADDAMPSTVWVTRFPDQGAQTKTEQEYDLDDLGMVIGTPPQAATKQQCSWIKLARYGDKRSDMNCLRHDANVIAVSGAEGDYDAGQVTLAQARQRLEAARIKAWVYTSPSYRPERPRWRVLVPFSHTYEGTPDELRALRKRFIGRVDRALGNVLASESYALSTAHYHGHVTGHEFDWFALDGDFVDTRDDLDADPLQERFREFLARKPGAAARYKGGTDGLIDKTGSAFDFSMTGMMKHARFTLEEIRTLLADWRYGSAGHRGSDAKSARHWQRCWDNSHAVNPETGAIELGEPLNIFRVPVAPPIPTALFPDVLRKFAVPAAHAAGHDPSAYLMACLAAAAGAIDDNVRILLRPKSDFFQSARLWVLLVGASSAAKTPAVKAATKPLYDLHGRLQREYTDKVREMKEDEARKEPRPAVVVGDSTIEALRDTLKDNPRGVIAIYEELDSWIGSHDAYRGGGGSKDRGEWLRLYDGGPHTVDRATGSVTQRHIFVPNWGCSILGATTYAALRRHAKNLPPDGLLQRFMVVALQPLKAWDDSWQSTSTKMERKAFEECLLEMRQLGKCTIKLSAEATQILNARQAEIAGAIDAVETLSPDLAAHLGKHIGMLGRIALTLHCLEHRRDAGQHEVSGPTMQASDQLLRVLLKHARCMYGEIGRGNDAAELAKAIGASIVADGLTQPLRSDLTHACRAFRDASDYARDSALRYLEDAAWLTPIMDRQYGGRPTQYIVNPRAHQLFADQGKALEGRRTTVREVFA